MSSEMGDKGISAFKRAQLRYRRQGAAPNRIDDLDDFLDFSNADKDDRIIQVDLPSTVDMSDIYQGPLYGISGFPGFLYAPQTLSPDLQTELAYLAVSEYCEPPHATNIDLVPPKAGIEENNINQSMWDLWKEENGHGAVPTSKQNRAKNHPSGEEVSKPWQTFLVHHGIPLRLDRARLS